MRIHRAVATGSAVALNIIAVGILGVSAAAPAAGAATSGERAATAVVATTSGERAATAVVATAYTNGMGYNFPMSKGMGYN